MAITNHFTSQTTPASSTAQAITGNAVIHVTGATPTAPVYVLGSKTGGTPVQLKEDALIFRQTDSRAIFFLGSVRLQIPSNASGSFSITADIETE